MTNYKLRVKRLIEPLFHTHYYDRKSMDSGTEPIDQSHREDSGIQLKCKMGVK